MAQCMTPFTVAKTSKGSIAVPCGKCAHCVARRVSAWSFRLLQQEKISISSRMLTLTYDNSAIPITANGFMSLNKRHLQLFFKKYRKSCGKVSKTPLRYYCCGEYGGRFRRPHYHCIMFNGIAELVQDSWSFGFAHLGNDFGITGAAIGYCLKYISKPARIPMFERDDRLPEFALMSKGLGVNYITPAIINWHHDDLLTRMYCNLPDGKKLSMPRYYKDKIYSTLDRDIIGLFTQKRMDLLPEFGGETALLAYQANEHQNSLLYRNSSQILIDSK